MILLLKNSSVTFQTQTLFEINVTGRHEEIIKGSLHLNSFDVEPEILSKNKLGDNYQNRINDSYL